MTYDFELLVSFPSSSYFSVSTELVDVAALNSSEIGASLVPSVYPSDSCNGIPGR